MTPYQFGIDPFSLTKLNLFRLLDGDFRPFSIELDRSRGADLLVLEVLCRVADPGRLELRRPCLVNRAFPPRRTFRFSAVNLLAGCHPLTSPNASLACPTARSKQQRGLDEIDAKLLVAIGPAMPVK
jgi:hypothetical protein